MSRPSGLGRGLSALLGDSLREEPASRAPQAGQMIVAVADITPNPDQPRRHFDETAMAELAESIASHGLIQPIIVRPRGGRYEIVAGERRWRAAQRARVHEIPVIVRDFDDNATFEVALLENIQRQDLNPIEEAEAYQRLMRDYGHGQEALGRIVGKSRSHVANLVRLLDLPAAVRDAVSAGRLSMGHARAVLTAADPEALAREIERRGLSVRETEALARSGKAGGAGSRRPRAAAPPPAAPDEDVAALERQLGDVLGLHIQITHGEDGGTVAVTYTTLDQLDMICQRLSGEPI